MSLAAKVLIGLVLGVVLGITAGEQVAFLGIVGRAFVLLLQMAVLPFVAVSLIAGLGGLAPAGARSLVRYAGGFLLVVWTASLLLVLSSPLAFPDWPAASYFSAALVEEREAFDFIGSYIPSNPFRSLSEGVVPAVVFFSVAFGLALMVSERKGALLDVFLSAQDALRRVTGGVIRLAPYGIFAIAAEAAGTISTDRLAGLQVYVTCYVVLSVLVAFWVLPALVAAVTPLSYRRIVGPARDALVTAFATGSLFVVLPILDERARSLLEDRGAGDEALRQVGVVVPIAFTLAGAGKLLGLIFVLYAGWQSGFPISPMAYPEFAAVGLLSSFAGSTVSLPFLLDQAHIPSDMFQLYLVVDSVIGGRFSALTGAMHAFSLALLAGCGVAGWVRLRPRQLATWTIVSAALAVAALVSIRLGFAYFDRPYDGYRAFVERSFSLPVAPWRDRDEAPDAPAETGGTAGDALRRVRERGTLRVGYAPDRLPYAFRNAPGQLVGFDVEMAHALARELGVRVDFFRTEADRFPALLDSGALDIVMTGFAVTPERLERMSFSTPYLEETLAFLVRDYRRDDFRTLASVAAMKPLRLAVPGRGYYAAKVRELLPDADISTVDSPRRFFRAPEGEYDALVFAAEAGSAWTLIYPQFSVSVPHPVVLRVPVGYATALRDRRIENFMDGWVALKRSDGTIGRLFRYWFEGKEPLGRRPRWSLARDVFGWGVEKPPESPSSSSPPAQPPAPAPVKSVEDAPTTPSPESVEDAPTTPSPESVEDAPTTPSPESVEDAPTTPSPESVEDAPTTPSPESVEDAPTTPSPESVEDAPTTPSPESVEDAPAPAPPEGAPVSGEEPVGSESASPGR